MSAGVGQRVRVKVCGVTRPRDAELAVDLGADLLGLNFWPGSSRFLETAAAREVAAVARGRAGLVGVFVNQPLTEIELAFDQVGLELAQLHGDEGPEDVAPLGGRAIKALRFEGAPDPEQFARYPAVWGFLLEARRAGFYGGVGEGWDYRAAAGAAAAGRRVLIAGGLAPENVRRAIAATRPWGVDVASGVESAPGRKDRFKLEKFFAEVRHAAE